MTPRLLASLIVLLLLVPVRPAAAQAALDVQLIDRDLEADGRTTLVVTVDGDEVGEDGVDPGSFSVSENGDDVTGLSVTPIVEEAEPPPSTVVIALDVSGSAGGEPIAAARDAAISLAETVAPQGVQVGLVRFGTQAEVVLPPTDDVATITEAIAGLEAGGNTALYDGVILAGQLLEQRQGERSILLFTDGADTASQANLDAAVDASLDADAPLTNVALITPEQDPAVLEQLAEQTGGRLLEVGAAGQLDAAFERVARSLTSQYVLRYTSRTISDELALSVTVQHEGMRGRLDLLLSNPRHPPVEQEPVPLPPPAPVELPELGPLGEPAVLAAALAAAFAAFLLVFWWLLVPRGDRAARRTLRRGLTMIQRGETGEARGGSGLSASAIGRAAVDLVARAPTPAGFDERRQTDIDRAGWQLRARELTAIQLASGLGGLVLLWTLSGRFWLGLIGAGLGAGAPHAVLSSARTRRQATFMKQLPDTLQLLAGTLKAGYGVMQAIDTIVREVEEPTSTEFQRALTEARLGLPLEDSLGDMANRIDNPDFHWVVVAMNIQRQVGGNLAELLETVAATLRGREQTRRQITALSAEGRLSAIILLVLPFAVVGFLLVSNAAYLAPLFTSSLGLVMVGGVGVLMVIGIIWMRNLIDIDV